MVAAGVARDVDSAHVEVDWVHQSVVVLPEACVEEEYGGCGDVVAGVAADVAVGAGCAAGRIAVAAVGAVGADIQLGSSAGEQQASLEEHIVAGNRLSADMGCNLAGRGVGVVAGLPEPPPHGIVAAGGEAAVVVADAASDYFVDYHNRNWRTERSAQRVAEEAEVAGRSIVDCTDQQLEVVHEVAADERPQQQPNMQSSLAALVEEVAVPGVKEAAEGYS